MSYHYYDDLSGDSSSDHGGGEESETDEDQDFEPALASSMVRPHQQLDDEADEGEDTRCIVHADVDCFYCQCETLDRRLDPLRPLAIGQKHIVVTCNYAARESGVTKLMLREEAYRRCPHLLIVEGSDLERYRIHARNIYESFRRTCQKLRPGSKVAKGSMDEMMADLSLSSSSSSSSSTASSSQDGTAAAGGCAIELSKDIYIYGSSSTRSHALVMTEDQTGAQTVVHSTAPGVQPTSSDNPVIAQRLQETATLALQIRQTILSETGFKTTLGVSCNPLLAKLASGLKKPGIVNILPPGRNTKLLVEKMPLRKIPGVGSRTIKTLVPCLEKRHGARDKSSSPWTCGELLRVPRAEVTRCLESMNTGDKSSAEQCSIIFDLCRCRDRSGVVDDQGGLQKTLSVENSFRRGTVRTKEQTLLAVHDLYRRLPRLFHNRTEWSTDKTKAYPTSIRLTVRSVAKEFKGDQQRRRPFSTQSKQMSFDGQQLLNLDAADEKQAIVLLRKSVAPLLNALVFSNTGNNNEIDITRINVALTSFQDVASSPKDATKRASRVIDAQPPSLVVPSVVASKRKADNVNPPSAVISGSEVKPEKCLGDGSAYDGIDPDVLSALPPDIAAEVLNGLHHPTDPTAPRPPKKKRTRIDQFFAAKK